MLNDLLKLLFLLLIFIINFVKLLKNFKKKIKKIKKIAAHACGTKIFYRRARGFLAQWIGWLWERVEQTFHPHHWGEGLGALGFHIKEKKVTAAKGGEIERFWDG